MNVLLTAKNNKNENEWSTAALRCTWFIRSTTPRCMAETLFPGSRRNLQMIPVAMLFGSKSLYLLHFRQPTG